jgi:hypothetical protein
VAGRHSASCSAGRNSRLRCRFRHGEEQGGQRYGGRSAERQERRRVAQVIDDDAGRSLREQAARISACTLKFFWEDDEREGWARGAIVTSGLRFKVPEDTQGNLWEDRVVLDEVFWNALREHPVPLLEAAIRQLRDRSMSLDIYLWLAWRCHQLGKPISISWPAVHAQFGAGFKAIKHFKPSFLEALSAATAAYPEARVEADDAGIHPASGAAADRQARGRFNPTPRPGEHPVVLGATGSATSNAQGEESNGRSSPRPHG